MVDLVMMTMLDLVMMRRDRHDAIRRHSTRVGSMIVLSEVVDL